MDTNGRGVIGLTRWARTTALLAAAALWLGRPSEAEPFSLDVQRRDPVSGERHVSRATVEPARALVVVIDMWDRHWCKTYTARVGNLVPRLNQTVTAARQLGLQIVWAPSDVIGFYQDAPQRHAMLAVPKHPAPATVPFNPAPEPVGKDCCECGPDRPCPNRAAWSRQQADLVIADQDLIGDCNDASELFNLCAERGIDTLIYAGVASNMCVSHRAFGMFNARRHGFRVFFLSDLVEAITANGFDPERQTPDWDFTPAKGSARTQRYLEQQVAASFESRQLLRLAKLGLAADDPRPHLVLVIADDEYRTAETLPAFARQHLENNYRCTFRFARGHEPPGRHDVPGLDALYDADLLVLSMRRRALPVVQMDHLERYLRAGKPLIALRVSVVPFQTEPQARADGHVIWRRFDEEILGGQYRGYQPEARQTGTDVWPEPAARNHPILAGLSDARFHSPMWVYRVHLSAPTTTVLLRGQWSDRGPAEPVAWINKPDGGRVFYTALGHWGDFELEPFRRLLRNAIEWALGR